jgi:hypothetical protein
VSIVQTFHDTRGSFRPIFHVDAPVGAPRLVLCVRFPATAVPARVRGYASGAHPSEVFARPIDYRPVPGRPLVEARMSVKPIPHREYWISWGNPATGTTSSTNAGSGGERQRTDLAFSGRSRARG